MLQFNFIHSLSSVDDWLIDQQFTQPNQAMSVRNIIERYATGGVLSHANIESDFFNTENFTEQQLLEMDIVNPDDKMQLFEQAMKIPKLRNEILQLAESQQVTNSESQALQSEKNDDQSLT